MLRPILTIWKCTHCRSEFSQYNGGDAPRACPRCNIAADTVVRGFCFKSRPGDEMRQPKQLVGLRGINYEGVRRLSFTLKGPERMLVVAEVPAIHKHCRYCDRVHDSRVCCPERNYIDQAKAMVPTDNLTTKPFSNEGLQATTDQILRRLWLDEQERRLR